jgi:hypothetical protein
MKDMKSNVIFYKGENKIKEHSSETKIAIGIIAHSLDRYLENDKESNYYAIINEDNKLTKVYINPYNNKIVILSLDLNYN